MTSTTGTVRHLLETTKASSVPLAKSEVIIIHSNENIHDGFKKLISNNVLSAPVVDVDTGKCTGFLDIRDLVSFVVFVDDDQHSDVPNDLSEILIRGTKMLRQPTEGVTPTYLSRRNPFRPVQQDDSLWTACELLAKGLHRIPVIDPKGKIVNIISQSTIVAFLHKHMPAIKHELSVTIKETNLGSKPVVCVNKNTTAIETFRLMDNKKISGVAVVDEAGKFVGNTSASDLKLFIKTLSLASLHEPIMQYLKKIRQESIDIMSPTISCSTKDTIAFVIDKLSITKVHKIFIADDENGYKPHCVVSITDIMRHLTKVSGSKSP
eukprot:TRINITY_DN1859_c0_g1_i1.p1 TRINITY_DN1859_c0_g1~~TRINITY_DN1859_c0_g1_i1.p1  ORF type:complete len:355 (-),score=76.84 TRINITY_DN1859_c0_g1_i1:114-1079(-)